MFNLLHSKKYKANRHSQPPYSIKLIIKRISRAYKVQDTEKGELTCIKNRIFCATVYDIETEGKIKMLQITTHHSHDTSFVSPSLTERSLLVPPHPALYRAAGRSAQGSHYLQNSTCEKKFYMYCHRFSVSVTR